MRYIAEKDYILNGVKIALGVNIPILLFVYLNSDVMGLYSCKEFMRTRNRLSMSFLFPFAF